MREIVKDGKILARHITPDDIKPGLISLTNDDEFLQVVAWGHYEKGKYLQDHWHNEFERTAMRTYEAVYIVKGAIEARLFDLNLVPVEMSSRKIKFQSPAQKQRIIIASS